MSTAKVRGVNHITLAVTDLDGSIVFYRDLLGFELRAKWIEGAYLEAGALWLCLSLDGQVGLGSREDYTHIALDVAEEDFETMADEISQKAKIWKSNRSEGASLYFLDPDGHKLELHCGNLASRLAHYRANRAADMDIS